MKVLPEDQWRIAVEDGSVLLGAWEHPAGIRHWVRFIPSRPADDHARLDNLKGLFVHIINAHAV